MKKLRFLGPVALTLSLLAVTAPVAAHHSATMFDRTKPKALKGVVKDFSWTNPHCTLRFVAAAEAGQPGELWVVEMTSPGVLTRGGWTKRSLNPGDHIDIELAPIRSGGPAGLLIQVKNLTTGATLGRALG